MADESHGEAMNNCKVDGVKVRFCGVERITWKISPQEFRDVMLGDNAILSLNELGVVTYWVMPSPALPVDVMVKP